MVRVKRGTTVRKRHKKIIAQAKGYYGVRKNVFKHAKNAVIQAKARAYKDRRRKKRDFRRLWTVRISAAVKSAGATYSRFISALYNKNILLNRKMLAEIAATDEQAFAQIVKVAMKES